MRMSYMTLCLWVNSMGYNKIRKYKNLSVNSHLTPNYTNLESDFGYEAKTKIYYSRIKSTP